MNEQTSWEGVDKTVVEKVAAQAGHPARDPYINTDQGDLLLFLFLLVLAFVIAGQVLQWSVTLLVQLVAGPDAGTITGALIASMVQAAMAVYLAAAMTSSYRQLDGASQPGPFG